MKIRSTRLNVEIAPPGTVYAGTRFDWTGFVTQVTLDGRHTFCVPENMGQWQGTGGIGLCNEFGIDLPIGVDDARPGDAVPKLGIGLIARTERADPRFGRAERVAQAFPMHVEVAPDALTFTVEPIDCRGYAARLVKRLTVRDNVLEIAYDLTNTGTRPFRTNEYNHNFVAVDGEPVGPDDDIVLAEPVAFALKKDAAGILDAAGRQLRLRSTPLEPFYCKLANFRQTDAPQWTLAHRRNGVSMSEACDFAPCAVNVWGTTHVVSVEVFKSLDLAPGASDRWARRYVFAVGPASAAAPL